MVKTWQYDWRLMVCSATGKNAYDAFVRRTQLDIVTIMSDCLYILAFFHFFSRNFYLFLMFAVVCSASSATINLLSRLWLASWFTCYQIYCGIPLQDKHEMRQWCCHRQTQVVCCGSVPLHSIVVESLRFDIYFIVTSNCGERCFSVLELHAHRWKFLLGIS